MASQRDLRRRIRDVAKIKQITRAMQFVAASKLKRAQDATLTARPYSEKIDEVLADLAAVLGQEEHPLLADHSETGKLDDVPTNRLKDFETQFYRYLEAEQPSILKDLAKGKTLTDEISKALDEAITKFRESFLA